MRSGDPAESGVLLEMDGSLGVYGSAGEQMGSSGPFATALNGSGPV